MANCIVRVRCGKCGKSWDTYWRDIRGENANICPFCGNEVDRILWDNSVFKAAAATLDANMEIEKDSTGYQKPGFSINFMNKKG